MLSVVPVLGVVPVLSVPVLSVIVPCYNERANVAPLVARLAAALDGIAWEAIFVDDNSPDGTIAEVRRLAAEDARVRGMRRIGRRGLASAVIEGALSASGAYVAVIDGDLQHDETILPAMLAVLRAGEAELVVGSRHVEGGAAGGLSSAGRARLSNWGNLLARMLLPVALADPMSGYFMLPRARFEELAPRLTGQGFKILLDLLLTARPALRVREVPYRFRPRTEGASKLDPLVLAEFAGLLVDKALGGTVPLRFLAFALVGAFGVLVNVAVLLLARRAGMGFDQGQILGTIAAMASNFELNNRLTYRRMRLRGVRLWRGLVLFMLVCGLGAAANIGIAAALFQLHTAGLIAGAAGAAVGVVWNYAVSATLVWRAR